MADNGKWFTSAKAPCLTINKRKRLVERMDVESNIYQMCSKPKLFEATLKSSVELRKGAVTRKNENMVSTPESAGFDTQIT
jgi:hypothetical protein